MELIRVNNIYYIVKKHLGVIAFGTKREIADFLLNQKVAYIL
jgi:hypothetical protein